MIALLIFFAILIVGGICIYFQNRSYMRKMHEEAMLQQEKLNAEWRAMSREEKRKMMAVGSAMFNGPFGEKP